MARRRANQEGALWKESKTGKWRAQIRLDGRRLSRTFGTEREATAWLREMRGQVDQGLTFKGTQTTLGDFLNDWLTSIQSDLEPDTHHHYSQIARDHIIPLIGSTRIAVLTAEHVQALLNAHTREGTGARTRQLIYSVLHSALNHAARLNMITRNPTIAIKRPKYEHEEMKILTGEQASALLLAARENGNEALYYLAITTGMRQGELLGLQWQDIDWQAGLVHVRRQSAYDQAGSGFVFKPPKTRSGRRVIAITNIGIELLREQQASQQIQRRLAGARWQEYDLVFPSSVGTPKNPSNLLKEFNNLLKTAGLPKIRFHDLRHTAVSLMIEATGGRVNVISRRLGHAQPGFTLNQYSHLLPNQDEEAAAAMDELILPVEIDLPNATKITRKNDD